MPYKPMDISLHDRHKLKEEELQRESIAYLFSLPDDGVAGYVYTWVNGFGRAGSAVFVYGPTVGEQPIELLVNGIQMADDVGFDDWQVGDVHIAHGDDESVVATVRNEKIDIDYTFVPSHPAYLYSNHPDGAPQFLADDRIEQSGHIKGVLKFDGKEIPFDTMGHRDHSWGTRHWGIYEHYKWFEFQAGPDLAVHFMDMHALGNRDVYGYVWRDGKMAEVTDVEVDFRYDEDFWHTDADMKVHDELGRTTSVKGEVFARYVMTPHEKAIGHEGSSRVTIEGVPGAGHMEMQWHRPYLEYVRSQDYVRDRATGKFRDGV